MSQPPISPRQSGNLALMLGIVLITGAAIMIPLGIALAIVGTSASIGFLVVGVVIAIGAIVLIRYGRRVLRTSP